MIKDYFILAVRNLKKRKLRSWLTMLGIFVSVTSIFVLISLSLGLQGAIQEQFRQLGTDKFFVMPKGNFGPGTTGAVELTEDDVGIIEKVSGVKEVTYMISGSAKIESDNQIRFFAVYGLPDDGMDLYYESGSMKIKEGKTFTEGSSFKIVVGYNFKYGNLFSKPVEVGNKILINGIEFKVSGVLDKIGNSEDDKIVLMNVEDFRRLFDIEDRVDFIFVQVENGQDIKEIANQVERKLMKFRDVNEKTIDFTILTPEELLTSFGSILAIITAFLISIASISLIVGAIGIANTMYTSVLERTKEIGVMKAIGARNSDVLWIFVIESGLLGFVGGVIGVVLGAVISKGLEYYVVNVIGTNLLKAAMPAYLILGCLFFAFIIGAVSGFFPARQASRIKTVDALRYE